MNCNEIRELLSLYIDQMLDEGQMQEVKEHLATCDSCNNEYTQIMEILETLGQLETIPMPESFEFRLKKALKEEKREMLSSGTIMVDHSKKKRRWRIITSIAAVFAVGVLSLGVYQDILGILPDKLSGGDQAGPVSDVHSSTPSDMKTEVITTDEAVGIALDEDEAYNSLAMVGNSQRENTSTAKKEVVEEMELSTYGFAADSATDSTEPEMNASAMTEAGEGADLGGSADNTSPNYKLSCPRKDCNRSMTVPGIERNTAAVQYYDILIKERLDGFDYQVLDSSYAQSGEWQFKIFIFRGKDGNTYNEEILIIGKEGNIQVICTNEFMGL